MDAPTLTNILLIVACGAVGLLVKIAYGIGKDVTEIKTTLTLTAHRVETQEKVSEKHETRIQKLETKTARI